MSHATPLHYLTIREAHELLRTKQISALELTRCILERIALKDPYLKSCLTVCEEAALQQATQADKMLQKKEGVTPLTGIPFAVKDCISTHNIRTTCASKILEDYIPQYDATVIQRLKKAGAVLLGKHNMDEFGMGSSCENSAYTNTHNPWDLTCVPGGSSGGSATAVAAGLATFALGEDTGGSIRMPASFCGVAGLKPTYGRVSRYGLIALASSFDTIGPITRDVYDNALVLGTIAGHDVYDSTSQRVEAPDYTKFLDSNIKGIKIGIPKEYFVAGMEPGVESAIREAIRHLETLGAQVEETSLPHTQYAIPVYYLILFAEASTNLARFDGIRFGLSLPSNPHNMNDTYLQTRQAGFGNEVKRRMMLGAYTLSSGYYDAYYMRAQKVRTLIRQDFEEAFTRYDVILTPTCPTTAFKLGEKVENPLEMYLSDIYVVATNPAGVPALSVPCGFSQGLPVGMQLIGRHMQEGILFRVGHAYQMTTNWHQFRPTAIDQ